MIKKPLKPFLLLIFTGLLLIGCADNNRGDPENGDMNGNDEVQILQFVATLLEIDENTILVEPAEGEDLLQSGDRVSINTDTLDPGDVPEMEGGDTLRIFYTGDVMESYPLQLEEVHIIEKVEK
ncbi:hypothetical protein [Isachenkonia alkalipeptolytica]